MIKITIILIKLYHKEKLGTSIVTCSFHGQLTTSENIFHDMLCFSHLMSNKAFLYSQNFRQQHSEDRFEDSQFAMACSKTMPKLSMVSKLLDALSILFLIVGAALNIAGLNSLKSQIIVESTPIEPKIDTIDKGADDDENKDENNVTEEVIYVPDSSQEEEAEVVVTKHWYYYLPLLVVLVIPVVTCVTLYCRSQRSTLVAAEPHHTSTMDVKVEHGEEHQFVVG